MRPKRNKIVYVPASDLKIHPSAQRKLVTANLKQIMQDLDLDGIGTLHVAPINGDLWIVDGQHRWTALMRHGFGDWKVACVVHEDATDHTRASELFLKLNSRAVLASYDKWVNEVQAGDPTAVGAKEVAEAHGFKIDRQSHDGHLACVNTLKTVYRTDNGDLLDETLGLIVSAFGHTAAAAEGKLIEGVAHTLAQHNGDLDREALTKKLAKYPGGASGILGDAKGLKKIRRASVPRCVYETIIESYNYGRRGGKVEVKR